MSRCQKQTYFTMLDRHGTALLCQYLPHPRFEDCLPSRVFIPDFCRFSPLAYVRDAALGTFDDKRDHKSNRKKFVMKRIIAQVSKAMKKEGFHNLGCLRHGDGFRSVLKKQLELGKLSASLLPPISLTPSRTCV